MSSGGWVVRMTNVRRKESATKTEIGRGVSKREWFESALRMMSDIGLTGTTVERLAEALGTSRSGFYWHFENKDDLLNQLLDYWAQEWTSPYLVESHLLLPVIDLICHLERRGADIAEA